MVTDIPIYYQLFSHIEGLTNISQETIIRKMKQGRSALERNQCNKFLLRTDTLERDLLAIGGEVAVKGLPFVNAFRAFKDVQESCMGLELCCDWIESIEKFSKAYKELDNISITPKVHLVIHHIKDFFALKGYEKGLSYWTEQAFEAVHHDFKV